MTSKGLFEAAVEFEPKHFSLFADCVGAVVPFSYNSNNYQIHFPKFIPPKPPSTNDPTATSDGTKIGLNWLDHKPFQMNYAKVKGWNVASSEVVEFSASSLIVRSSKPVTAAKARQMKKDLGEWRDAFAEWLEVLEYRDLSDEGVDVNQDKVIRAYFLPTSKDGKTRRIKRKGEGNAQIIVRRQAPINLKALRKALRWTNLRQPMPLYYVQLMSALRHLNAGEYRQSLLDSATAVEISMTQLLDDKLTGRSEAERRKLRKAYRQLSGLTIGLTTLGVPIPSDIQTNVGKPRNAAMHAGATVSQQQAQAAADTAKEFIYTRLPL